MAVTAEGQACMAKTLQFISSAAAAKASSPQLININIFPQIKYEAAALF